MFYTLWSPFCRENTLHKLKKSGGVTFGNERPLVTEMVCIILWKASRNWLKIFDYLPVLSNNKTIWFLTMQFVD